MQIEYDPAKDASNRKKHGVPLYDATRFEWDTAHIEEDRTRYYDEQRFKATGVIDGRLYALIYCLRGEVARVISLREAERKEVKDYVRYIEKW